MTDHLADAVSAHREALSAQQAMSEAAARRAVAVRGAIADGITPTEIAEALGVQRERVYAMKKEGKA